MSDYFDFAISGGAMASVLIDNFEISKVIRGGSHEVLGSIEVINGQNTPRETQKRPHPKFETGITFFSSLVEY